MAGSSVSTTLTLRHVFGANVGVTDNLSFTDEETVVYVAGHSIVLYFLTEKRQKFLNSSEISDCITAYTSGPGKRLCAIAERGERSTMHVFDLRTLRRKKSITTSDLISKDIVSMQFSEDNQLLLALSGAPDWSLMCWNWARAKLVASISVSLAGSPMYKCMFSPLDASVTTVIGKDCVKFFRIGEREIRALQENVMPGNTFISFCWMRNPDDHLLVGTEEGKIMLFRSGEFVTLLPCSPGPNYPITSLNSITGGFVAGSVGGTLFFFSYDESKDQALFDTQFKLINVVTASELANGSINCIALDPKDEKLCALSSDGQIITMPCAQVNAVTAEQVKYMATAFHGPKNITGLDVAVRKPLILSCSKDATLRLWNIKNHTLELSKVFPEEMFSCALHPTGLHCAVGFTDKLRGFHILVNEFRLCMEVPIKGCRECKFSSGGNYLAATNGNSVSVYDFYTGEKVADLRGHNSKVRAIHWMPSGYQLLTCGAEGAVYLWTLDGAKRIAEFVQKGTTFSSVCHTPGGAMVVGNDRSMRDLAMPDFTGKAHDAGLILTHVALSLKNSVLFATTFEYSKPGYIRAYPYPLSGDFDDYPCTNSQILRMRLTADENFLVVADEQGCLCLMELRNRQDRFQRNNATTFQDLLFSSDWSDEVLVTRAELEDCNTTVNELKTKVDELKLNNEYQLKLRDMQYAEKIKETTDKFLQELEIAKSRFEMLQEVRVDYEIEAIEKLKYMEEMHQNNVQSIETGYQAQIMELVDRYQKLVKERDGQIERLDEQRRDLVKTHEHYVNELTTDYEHKLTDEQKMRLKLEEEKLELDKELSEMQNQLEDDIDTEIDNMKHRYENTLQTDREATMKFKQDNGTLKKKGAMLQRNLEDRKEEMKSLTLHEHELMEQIKLLEREVSAHKKEIKTRDSTIGDKEKRIYELKKKNQELDKFKFVLDFKIRELKQQIEPRQKDIMDMRIKIKDLDLELEKYHKSNSSLDTFIGDLRNKIDSMQNEVKKKRMTAKQLENTIATCRSEVQAAMNLIQTPKDLLIAVQKIVLKYGSTEIVRPRVDPEVEDEYNRHREYLQRSILELKKALEQGSTHHMMTNSVIRNKNMELINEINAQREANRALKGQVQAEIGRIRHFMQAMNMRKQQQNKSNKTAPNKKNMKDPLMIDLGDNEDGTTNVLTLPAETNPDFLEPSELLERNRRRITALRQALEELHIRGPALITQTLPRDMLPAITVYGLPNSAGGGENGMRKSSSKQLGVVALPPIQRDNLKSPYIEGQGELEYPGIDPSYTKLKPPSRGIVNLEDSEVLGENNGMIMDSPEYRGNDRITYDEANIEEKSREVNMNSTYNLPVGMENNDY